MPILQDYQYLEELTVKKFDTLKMLLMIILPLCLTIGLISGAASLFSYLNEKDKISEERNAEYEDLLAILTDKVDSLESDIRNIDNSVLHMPGGSYLSLIFTELDERVFTELYPIMSTETDEDGNTVSAKHKIEGTLALSEKDIPGMDGKITMEQYDILTSLGWSTSLYYSGEGDFSDFLRTMQDKLSLCGIQMPGSVVFAHEKFKKEYEPVMLELGINIALHNGDLNMRFIERNEPSDSVWHPGYLGWVHDKSDNMAGTMANEFGVAALTVDFSKEYGNNTSYVNSEKRFAKMISVFRKYEEEGTLAIVGPEQARENMLAYFRDKEDYVKETEIRKNDLRKEIEKYDREMIELYERFFGEVSKNAQ